MLKELRICEIRAETPTNDNSLILDGTPIVYDEPTVINDPKGIYTEIIRPGALDSADIGDSRLLYNHNLDKVPLARTPKTMQLIKSQTGLKMTAHLPDTEEAKSIYTAVKRGDLSGMSFAFSVPKGGDKYDPKTNTREIFKISKVYEVSITPFPAYPQTSIEARNNINYLKEITNMKFKTVAEAFNHYKVMSITDIETRMQELQQRADEDHSIELDGLKEAKANIEQRAAQQPTQQYNPITGMGFTHTSSQEAIKGDVFESPEYRSAFFKTLLGQGLTDIENRAYNMARQEKRADAFNTLTSSASVLPTQTLNEIIKKARTIGGLMPYCRSFNIPTKLSVPIGTPSNKANWHIEGEEVSREKADTTKVDFSGYEILKVFSMSAASKRMSISAFESYIISELSTCVMETIADSIINGTGVGQGTGLLNGITWTASNNLTYDKVKGLAYTDCTKVVASLKRGYSSGAVWAMNNASLYNLFYGLVDINGRPIFITDPKGEGIGKILGFQVVIDDNIPDETIFFGNFNYYGYNIPEGIAVETSRESSFTSGLIDYRAMAIADCKPLVSEAFIKLTKAA